MSCHRYGRSGGKASGSVSGAGFRPLAAKVFGPSDEQCPTLTGEDYGFFRDVGIPLEVRLPLGRIGEPFGRCLIPGADMRPLRRGEVAGRLLVPRKNEGRYCHFGAQTMATWPVLL